MQMRWMPSWSHANGKTSAQVKEKFLTGEKSTELQVTQWGSAHMQGSEGSRRDHSGSGHPGRAQLCLCQFFESDCKEKEAEEQHHMGILCLPIVCRCNRCYCIMDAEVCKGAKWEDVNWWQKSLKEWRWSVGGFSQGAEEFKLHCSKCTANCL